MLPLVALAPGYAVPRLIRGTWQLHEAAATLDRDAALADLGAAADLGFTAIEAADSYDGVEALLGEFRRRRGPGLRVHTRVSQSGAAALTPAEIRARVERARRRLGQDRLDLVQLQWWNLALPGWLEAGLELAACRREGLIAEIGVTNFPAAPMVALLNAGVPVATNQVQMSLLDPRAQATLRPACARHGVTLLGYGPLAGGFLSEAWRRRPDPGLEPGPDARFGLVYRRLVERFGGWAWLQDLLEVLAARAARHGADIAAVALAWTLARSGAAALLVGFSRAARARSYLRAAALALDAADFAAIDAVLRRRGPVAGDVADMERAVLLDRIAASYAPP